MQKIIPFTDITACGVWHRGKMLLSSLDEAAAALGGDCYIINGGFFNASTGAPASAYSIDGADYHTGGSQFGYAFFPDNTMRWTYLRSGGRDFIGAYPMYLSGGATAGIDDGKISARTTLGLSPNGVYIGVESNITITSALNKAYDAGCLNAINLDGGGSSQYHLPDGTNYYGTDPKRRVLNWVFFKIRKEGSGAGLSIVQDIIPLGRRNRPGKLNPCKYITIHNTGNASNGAGAKNHAAYLKGDAAASAPVSWHYTVDDMGAYQHLPDTETAYHAGDGVSGTGNAQSIGIEICENPDSSLLKATDNAVILAASLCRKHGIPAASVVQHNRWNGKSCPARLRAGQPYTWDVFIAKVTAAMAPEPRPATGPQGKTVAWAELAETLRAAGYTAVTL